MNHYEELGVMPSAPPEVIEAAWKAQMRIYHTDNGTRPNKERAQRLNIAHDVLKDRVKRAAYDKTLLASKPAPNKPRRQPPVSQGNGSNVNPGAYPLAYDPAPYGDLQSAVQDATAKIVGAAAQSLVDSMFESMPDPLRMLFEQAVKKTKGR